MATRSIHIALYGFTGRDLPDELGALARRGVRIRVYRDREQFQQGVRSGNVTMTGTLLETRIEARVKSRFLELVSTGPKHQDNVVRYEPSTGGAERFELKFEKFGKGLRTRVGPRLESRIYQLIALQQQTYRRSSEEQTSETVSG